MTYVSSGDDAALASVHGETLQDIAVRSIRHGLGLGPEPLPQIDALPKPLQQHRATFVTLETDSQLRGCVGTAMACRPVALDVAFNAHGAAFRDIRFTPLRAEEWASLTISISILSPMEPMIVADEGDLLARLRPGIDGLLITEGQRRGLFLPQVWEQLPDPRDFVAHLKQKAGIAADYWSAAIAVQRFAITYIPARAAISCP